MSLLAIAPLGLGTRTVLSRRPWPLAPGRMRLIARAAEPSEANSSRWVIRHVIWHAWGPAAGEHHHGFRNSCRPVQKAVEPTAVEVKEPALAVEEPAGVEQAAAAAQAATAGAAATEASGAQATAEQDPLIKPLSEQWVKVCTGLGGAWPCSFGESVRENVIWQCNFFNTAQHSLRDAKNVI